MCSYTNNIPEESVNKEIATAYAKAKEDLKSEEYLDDDYELTVQGRHELRRIYG